MGSFHIIHAFLETIGKRFEGSGLGDLFVEAGIVACGSLKGVMSGTHYNHAVRAHKTMYEAPAPSSVDRV